MFRRRPSTADSTCRRLPISQRVFDDPRFYETTIWYVDAGYSRNGKYRIFRYCWSPDGTEPSAPIIPGVTVMPWSRRSHSHISKEDIRISARDWNNRAAASEGLQAPSHDSHTILRVVRKYQKRRLLRDHCKSETRTFSKFPIHSSRDRSAFKSIPVLHPVVEPLQTRPHIHLDTILPSIQGATHRKQSQCHREGIRFASHHGPVSSGAAALKAASIRNSSLPLENDSRPSTAERRGG